MPQFDLSRLAAAVATAGVGLALAATPALADSVAYIKDGNVWLAATDGSRQYQVTFDGGYSSVSQADAGDMVALHGDHIRHLRRDGTLIADIATPVSTTNDPSMSFKGPFDPQISPNGKRVSYTYYWQYTGYDPYCNPSTNCYVKRLYHGTAFTDPDRLTAWDEPGFLRRSGWIDAAWVDDEQVLLSDPYIQPNEDTVLWKPSDKDSLARWFQDPAYPGDVADSTISRDKSAMATVTSSGKRMSILRSEGRFFPNYPERCYEASVEKQGDAAEISSPTLSSTGTRILWAEPDGIHAATLPKFTFDSCGTLADAGGLVIPGASSPAWGPADVPAPRPVENPGTGTGGGQQPGTGSGGGASGGGASGGGGGVIPTTGATRLTVASARLRTALSRGLVVRLTGARAGRQAVTVQAAGRRVAGGAVQVGADGRGQVRVRFTRAARRSLARKRAVRLTFSGAGARAAVTLKR